MSVSTVRRYERDRLHPVKEANGAWSFDPAEVAALAAELLGQQPPPGTRSVPQEPAPELARGELAGRVFERLEQRQTLAEIVIGLRIAPELVRALHHEWLVGLTEGELQKAAAPALPTDDQRQARERHIDRAGLARLLADLPMGTRTRLSLARDLGEYMLPSDDADGYPREARNVIELGGFLVLGPIEVAEIARRYGRGEYRLTAYGFDPLPGVRWEVFVSIDRETEIAALGAVELPVLAALPGPAPMALPPAAPRADDRAGLQNASTGDLVDLVANDRANDRADERDGQAGDVADETIAAPDDAPSEHNHKRPFGRLRTELAAALASAAPAARVAPSSVVPSRGGNMAEALAKYQPALAPETDDAQPAVRELGARVRAVLEQMPAISDDAARTLVERLGTGEITAAVTALVQARDPDALGAALASVRALLSPIEWDGFELLGEQPALWTRLIASELARDVALGVELARGQLAISLVTRLAQAKGLAANDASGRQDR